MARALARILVASLLGVLLLPAASLADGDPASDMLLGQSVFYPYMPPVAAALQRSLNTETSAARRSGFPIKVALIGSRIDLGVISELFGKPQRYADFLDRELGFIGRPRLLVVMATGYGVQGIDAAIPSLRPPAGTTSNDLAQAAIDAVAKLAAAAGHPIQGVAGISSSSSTTGSSSSTEIVIALAVAAILVAAGVLVLRHHHAAASRTAGARRR